MFDLMFDLEEIKKRWKIDNPSSDIPILALLSKIERQRKRIEELENIVGQLRDQQSKIKAQSDFAHRVWREKT